MLRLIYGTFGSGKSSEVLSLISLVTVVIAIIYTHLVIGKQKVMKK